MEHFVLLWVKIRFSDFVLNPGTLKTLRTFLSDTIYANPASLYAEDTTMQLKTQITGARARRSSKAQVSIVSSFQVN